MKQLFKLLVSKVFWINVVISIVFLFLIILVIDKGLKWYTKHGESVTVMDFRGMQLQEAEQMQSNLRYLVYDSAYSQDYSPYTIIDQIPDSGQRVKENRTIYLVINTPTPPLRMVPDLEGKASLKSAITQLEESMGFKVGELIYKPSPDLNAVIELQQKGERLEPGIMIPAGSTIDLVLGNGSGNHKIEVPNLLGTTFLEAQFVLKASSLNLGFIRADEDVVDTLNAFVYHQMPHAGENSFIRIGDPMDLLLSKDFPAFLIGDTTSMQLGSPIDTIKP